MSVETVRVGKAEKKESCPALDDCSLPSAERLERAKAELRDELTTAAVKATELGDSVADSVVARWRQAAQTLAGLEEHGEEFFSIYDAILVLEGESSYLERTDALRELGKLEGKGAVDALIEYGLADDDLNLRAHAILALSNVPHRDARTAILERGLEDASPTVRKAAVIALKESPDEMVAARLSQMSLLEPDRSVFFEVVDTLKSFPPELLSDLDLQLTESGRKRAVESVENVASLKARIEARWEQFEALGDSTYRGSFGSGD